MRRRGIQRQQLADGKGTSSAEESAGFNDASSRSNADLADTARGIPMATLELPGSTASGGLERWRGSSSSACRTASCRAYFVSVAFSWIPFINILGIILGFIGIILGLVGLFFYHRIMSLIGIVLALGGVILRFVVTSSAVSSIGHAVDAPSPSAGPQSAPSPTVPPAFQGATVNYRVAQAGEVVNTNGLSLTSSAAVKRGDSTFGKSLCTTVKYGSGTDAAVSFNGFDWKLQGPNGAILSTTIGGSRNVLNSGDLAPGGSVSGDVCFDAKSGAQGQYVVLYQGSIFSGDRIAWLNKI